MTLGLAYWVYWEYNIVLGPGLIHWLKKTTGMSDATQWWSVPTCLTSNQKEQERVGVFSDPHSVVSKAAGFPSMQLLAHDDHDKTTPVYDVQESEEFQPVNLQWLPCLKGAVADRHFFDYCTCLSFSFHMYILHFILQHKYIILVPAPQLSKGTNTTVWAQ